MRAAPQLLIVWHSRTGFAGAMARAAERGAYSVSAEMGAPLDVVRVRAADATAAQLLRSDGFVFAAPENLASVSGMMKDFFDRNYYAMFEASGGGGDGREYSETSRLLGRPFALMVAAGSDGSGAVRQVERICRGWRLRPVAESLVERNALPQTAAAILEGKKQLSAEATERCEELGGLAAATLLL